MSLWKSNLILSDIPWDYYLHPCPKFYALELAKHGPTLWVNPPSRNPAKFRIFRPGPNLKVLTPWMYRRPSTGSGFDRPETRMQVRILASAFLGKPTSTWSISTPYDHLLEDFSPSCSIFWSGDFFDPVGEFESYKNFDLVLCLTPPKFEAVPIPYTGQKAHFNMCCDLSLFGSSSRGNHSSSMNTKINRKSSSLPIAGYIGTLSDRRINYPLLTEVIERLPKVKFVLVGKRDSSPSTNERLHELRANKNVRIVEDMEYAELPSAIRSFDVCLIPYHVNDENIGTCPTKFIEYCAVGKPIVSANLPGISKFEKLVQLTNSPEEFAHQIELQITDCTKDLEEQRKLARLSSPSFFLEKFTEQLENNRKN
jgi:glycosyltransferase involved in cell wall biosynthesis